MPPQYGSGFRLRDPSAPLAQDLPQESLVLPTATPLGSRSWVPTFPRRSRPADGHEPVQRGDRGEARLWRLGTALAVSFTVAVVGLAGLAWLAWVLLGVAGYRHHGAPALKDTVGVVQLVFASVAGAGALVALIVAYRRQKIAEADSAHDRTRVFNERFTAIAAQLGDAQPAVRLAGVHAMAGLADDWKQNRQTCVDVLCAYLRLPYDPDPGDDAAPAERAAYRANREVRHTIIRLIGAHLRPGAAVSWQGLNLDFTGVVFDGGDFTGAEFSGGTVSFDGAEFSGGTVSFDGAEFSGGTVGFGGAGSPAARSTSRRQFSGGTVSFAGAEFSGGTVSFDGAEFSGGAVSFAGAEFSGGTVSFGGAKFSGGGSASAAPSSPAARSASTAPSSPAAGQLRRRRVLRRHGRLRRRRVLRRRVSFGGAGFSGGTVGFDRAGFSGGTVSFGGAGFSGGEVSFGGARFSGGTVSFGGAEFSGGTVSFDRRRVLRRRGQLRRRRVLRRHGRLLPCAGWAHPPMFSWDGEPPLGGSAAGSAVRGTAGQALARPTELPVCALSEVTAHYL